MTDSTHKKERPFLPIAGALATAVTFVLVLCFFFEPTWETNDDVAMSMVAHGYGIAATESPNLFFSNVLWGHLVRLIPEINGVLGYSIATMATLIVVGTVVLYGLYQMGAGLIVSLSVFVLIMVRPLLFPQFTINAGLLMIGGIICWHLYDRQNNWRVLAMGCVLAFFSFLIRKNECLLILIVAIPLLPWRSLFQRRSFKLATLILLLAITVSSVINHSAYQQERWKTFNEFNLVRASFTDFQAALHLKKRPDIFERYGFSINDIDLINSWFFAVPELNNTQNLQAMIAELGILPWFKRGPKNFFKGLSAIWNKKVLVLFITALLLIALRIPRRGTASLGLILAAIFLMSLLGRPGVTRVYTPLISLLIVAPFLVSQVSVRYNKLVTGALLLATVLNCSFVFSEARKWHTNYPDIQRFSTSLPKETIVLWGATLPLETIYSVLRASPSARSHRFYALGVFTLAPFSVAFEEEQNKIGLMDRLKSESGIPFFVNPESLEFFEKFCIEHLHSNLKEVSSEQFGKHKLRWLRCAPQVLTSK